LTINIQSTADLQRRIAASLADKSGVTQASIKRFETSGEVSLANLLNIAFALNCTREFDALFDPVAPNSIAELQSPPRQRGSR